MLYSMNMTNTHKTQSTTIVLFGAMGDLAWRKLLPSLFDLYTRGMLPNEVRILGVSREDVGTDGFVAHVREKVEGVTDEFLQLLSYFQMDLLDADAYTQLDAEIVKSESEGRGNRLFHLAVPPTLYKQVLTHLGENGVAREGKEMWSRILVEKPFGYDSATAQELNNIVDVHLSENQVYRVDHYLAKEAVEGIMAFRFSNALFSEIWSNTHITSVHVRMHETLGVENRGAFYETVGALRDVGQNHLLQLLALIAMEQPLSLKAQDIAAARAEVLTHLQMYSPNEVAEHTFHAQYEGYRDIPKTDPESQRETYFAIRAFVDKPQWSGVPFIIEGGKALSEARIDITLEFKRKAPCLCTVDSPAHEHANTLTFTLKPENKTEVSFWVKEPGFDYVLEQHALSFTHSKEDDYDAPDAYTEIIYDALRGKKTVFPSNTEIEASWKFVDAILAGWQSSATKDVTLYLRGSTPDISGLL